MSTAVIEQEYIDQQTKDREPIVALALELVITGPESYLEAGKLLTEFIKPGIREVHKHCDPICAATNTAHKVATAGRGNLLAPWESAETLVKCKLGDYDTAQDLLRVLEERRIENERLAEQAAAQIVADKEAEEIRVKEAALLEAEGRPEEAETLLAEPAPQVFVEPAPAPVSSISRVKAKGVSSRVAYEGNVTNFDAFIKAVVEGHIPKNCIQVAQGALNKHINANDGKVQYPGCTITSKRIIGGRVR